LVPFISGAKEQTKKDGLITRFFRKIGETTVSETSHDKISCRVNYFIEIRK